MRSLEPVTVPLMSPLPLRCLRWPEQAITRLSSMGVHTIGEALRLPRGLNVKAKSYEVTPTATGFVITDPKAEARRLRALQALWGSAPDFPDHTK